MSLPWRVAWITGASSGIGAEMALQLAENGVIVAVTARTQSALDEMSKAQQNLRA